MKIIPPGVSFEQAVRAGLTGRIDMPLYLAWLRTLPCDSCGTAPPSTASHLNSFKGGGTKAPDLWSIPECGQCNRRYDLEPPAVEHRLARAAVYLLRAAYEGRLVWRPRADNRWIVVKECAPQVEPGKKPVLAYMTVFEWPTFTTSDEALGFIKGRELPLGWVVMQESQLRLEGP